MPRNATELEQAVSRTLRDSLEKLQRTTDELNQAVSDLVSACASSRPANTLPPMMRAQTAAVSLSASLEVLTRFVAGTLQPGYRPVADFEAEPAEPPETPKSVDASRQTAAAAPITETVVQTEASKKVEDAPAPADAATELSREPTPAPRPVLTPAKPFSSGNFDLETLAPEERELHRRADRVAKVAMQDIKMLRPDQVNLGKERKDLCTRLGDDIDKARREYDRRFQAVLDKPVDYFYNRMVEILGDGDPSTLGEYPYPSPVLGR
jgi:hypothetical protein